MRYPLCAAASIFASLALSVTGTLVGAFFGLQIGQAGAEHERRNRQMAEQSRQRAEEVARMALAHLPPDTAKEVLSASQERSRESPNKSVQPKAELYKVLGNHR